MTTSFNLRLFSQHKTPAAAVIQHYLCCSLNVHNVDFPSMQSSFFFYFLSVLPEGCCLSSYSLYFPFMYHSSKTEFAVKKGKGQIIFDMPINIHLNATRVKKVKSLIQEQTNTKRTRLIGSVI